MSGMLVAAKSAQEAARRCILASFFSHLVFCTAMSQVGISYHVPGCVRYPNETKKLQVFIYVLAPSPHIVLIVRPSMIRFLAHERGLVAAEARLKASHSQEVHNLLIARIAVPVA